MQQVKDFFENKHTKRIMTIFRILIFIILAAFILVVLLQRISNNRISVLNYRIFTVVSGSMEPRYNVGDVLISKEVDPETIKVGDTISYLGEKGDFINKVITHEVVGISKDDNGKYLFQAKGLTNLVVDPIIYERQLYGVVKYKTIILSAVYRIVSTKLGFYLFIILPLIFVIGSEIVATLVAKEDKRRGNV